MNKLVYLDLSILELSKIVMCDFQYDYVKPKYEEKAKLCYMDSNISYKLYSIHKVYKDIAEDVEPRFDCSNFDLDRAFSKEQNFIELSKDALGGQIMKEFVGLRAKSNSYLINDDREDRHKNRCHKKYLKFQDYKKCFEAAQRK